MGRIYLKITLSLILSVMIGCNKGTLDLQLETERKGYAQLEEIQFKITLTNTRGSIRYNSPSTHLFDITIFDRKGRRLYSLSDNTMYAQVIRPVVIQPGENKFDYIFDGIVNNRPLDLGKYTAEIRMPISDDTLHSQTEFWIVD